MKLNRLYLLAAIIFVVAVLLRFLYIDTIPDNLTMDEVNNGYTAYSLLKTNHDEWGNFLPFSFRSVGDYKPPVLIYLTVPSVALFGLNEFSVRFPVALASVFSLLFIFFLSKKFIFAKQPSWFHRFVLFLFATSPWHIIFSRSGYEAVVALLFFLINILLLLQFIKEKRPILLALAITFAFLSVFTYHSYKVFTPLMNLLVIFVYRQTLLEHFKHAFGTSRLHYSYLAILSLLIFLSWFLITQYLTGPGATRASMVFISSDYEYKVALIDKLLKYDFHHYQYLFFPLFWFKRYLDYFSPNFYLYSGLELTQAGHIGSGVTGFAVFCLFITGLYALIFNKGKLPIRQPIRTILLGWLFIGFLPASLANNVQQPLRSLAALPAILFIAALGFLYLFHLIKNRFHFVVIILFLAMLFVFDYVRFVDHYLVHYPYDLAEGRHYGWKQIHQYLEPIKDNYHQIYVDPRYGHTGRTTYSVPYLYFLFYSQYDPLVFQQDPLRKQYDANFDKFVFGDIDWQSQDLGKNNLFVASPWSFTIYKGPILHTVYFPDGVPALHIIEGPK